MGAGTAADVGRLLPCWLLSAARRSTIERHLLSSATDPFSRAPLSLEQLLPDEVLAARIEQWLQQHREQQRQQHGLQEGV